MPLQNNTLSRAELNDEFGTAQNIHYGDVLIKYDEVLDVSKESLSYIEKQSIADKFKTSYLQNGDVIIADTAEDETVGKCTEIEGLTDQKVISGLHTMPVRPNRKFAAGFLGFYLNSAAYHDQLKPLMQGIKVTSISKGVMQDTVVKFPLDLKEQEQIGMYFSGLDHLITLHQKKCFEWKKRDFASVSISWEQRKLADIVERITRKNENLESILPLTISAQYGLIDQNEFFDKRIASKDVSGYYLVRKGEFAYNKSTSSDAPWGAIKRLDRYECGVLSTLYIVFRILDEDKTNSDYLVTYYDTVLWHKGVQAIAAEGARNHGLLNIAPADFFETKVAVPKDIEEQRMIGAYFMRLDHLITLHQRKLELLERLRNSLVDRCFIGEKCTMSKLILYHGSPNRVIAPKFGFGEDRHDYGRGFYLTENLELAKEWAVCRPDETNGWVHKYELEMEGLNILDFQKYDVLSWLAELMKHRDAADSRRYKMLAQKFIEKYGIDTCGYDVITGWRANASYFYIAKEFVRDNIDIEILEELLSLGGLGIQFCIKSERAFAQLSEVEQDIMSVDYSEFNDRYNERDINARNKMRALVDSDANKVTHVFSTLFER